MGWFGWLGRARARGNHRTNEWRRKWAEAIEGPTAAGAHDLRTDLEVLATGGVGDDDLEIEREMQEGLEALLHLAVEVGETGPPTIVTGHRAVGSDACHFSAPASLPDDPAQPSGTLLLTRTRLVFVGGARAVTIPWHAVGQCTHQDRDVVLVRRDRPDLHRLRCNTFSDALCATFLARQLTGLKN
jgi:hypothetical protein